VTSIPVTEHAELAALVRSARRSNARLGLRFFLAAEGVFFLGLVFVALSVRRGQAGWPPPGAPQPDYTVLLINTAVLLVSGITALAADRSIRAGRRSAMLAWTAATAALGAVFVGGQLREFAAMGGWSAGEGVYATLFNVLSGLHGAHVAAGILLLLIVLARAVAGSFGLGRHAMVTVAAWFWFFVSTAWLALLGVLLIA